MVYRRTAISHFTRAVLMASVSGLGFRPRGTVLTVITLQLLPCSLLKAARPKRFPDKLQAGSGVLPSSSFPRAVLWTSLLSFRRGPTLHNIQTPTFINPMESSTARFATTSPWVCPNVSYNVFLLPRGSSCFRPLSLTPLLNFSRVLGLFSNIRPLWAPRTT
jgi:hypothetical protein